MSISFKTHCDYKPTTLAPNTKLPNIDQISDGNIILIRFIRSDKTLSVFGEKFRVSKDLARVFLC